MNRHPGVRDVRSRRDRLKRLRAAGGRPALAEWARERATAAYEGFPAVPVLLRGGSRTCMVWAIECHGDAVHVWTDRERSDAGHLVVVNPPNLVADENGAIERREGRYREDPGQALVEVVLAEMGTTPPIRYRPRGGFPGEGVPVAEIPPGTAEARRAGGQP